MSNMWTHSIPVATLLAAISCAIGPDPAQAGTYVQYACRHPDGTPAASDGWWVFQQRGGRTNPCAAPAHYLLASLPSVSDEGASATIDWLADEVVTLRSFTLHRGASVPASSGAGRPVYRVSTISGSVPFVSSIVRERCDPWEACTRVWEGDLTVSGLDLRHLPNEYTALQIAIACESGACSTTTLDAPSVFLTGASLTLEDAVRPTYSNVGGNLAREEPVWGVSELTYRAADVGGGVYRHKLVVDGTTVVDEVADANGGKCRDAMPGWGTPYEFDYTRPCAGNVDGHIRFDLNRIGSGRHDVEASVEDAAGNARTIHSGVINVVSDPARRDFDADGVVGLVNPLGDRPGLVLNGVGSSRRATVGAYVRRVRHERERGFPSSGTATYPNFPAVVVRVKASGRPIAGAVVSVLEREAGSEVWRVTRTVRTTRLGGASVRLAPGPSRDVRFAYVPDSESTTFISSRSLSVRIRPRVLLTASPPSLRTGQRVRFSGRVAGGPLPSTGLALALQASGPDGRWLTFKTIRTTASGRFQARYRFTATTGTVRYRFRIRVLRQGGYPFAAAYSRPVSVRVKG
jgi:hypothetical protein